MTGGTCAGPASRAFPRHPLRRHSAQGSAGEAQGPAGKRAAGHFWGDAGVTGGPKARRTGYQPWLPHVFALGVPAQPQGAPSAGKRGTHAPMLRSLARPGKVAGPARTTSPPVAL